MSFLSIHSSNLFCHAQSYVFSHHTCNPLMGHKINLMGLFLMNESRKCQSASHTVRVRVVNFFSAIYKLIYTHTCPISWMSNELLTLACGQKSERSPGGGVLFRLLINRDGEGMVRELFKPAKLSFKKSSRDKRIPTETWLL